MTGMTMVERVARLLAAKANFTDGDCTWREHIPFARDIIAEMREPTEAMIDDGAHAAHSRLIGADDPREDWMSDEDWEDIRILDHWPSTQFHIDADRFRECAKVCLNAAIDTALSEGGEG